MTMLMRWYPSTELVSLGRAMDRLFEDGYPWRVWSTFEGSVSPAIDVYQTDESVVVKAALPGIKPEDVEITITGYTISISGETKAEEEVKKENYFYQERRIGSFRRVITLPEGLKTDHADATFENGVLTISIPKAEEAKPKQFKVKVK